MIPMRIDVPTDAKGLRLDKWLSEKTKMTRSQIKRLFSKDAVTVNGKIVHKAGFMLDGNETIVISEKNHFPEPVRMPLDIVYEDEWLIVVNKPVGLLVYPVKDPDELTLVNGLLAYTTLSHLAGNNRPGLVHRIDRDTSGLIMAAKSDFVHEKLYQMLENHDINREYIGIVQRPFATRAGVVDKAISVDYVHGIKRKVVDTGGLPSVTHFRCVINTHEYALMAFRLESGRTHQIRVHMAAIGHPLVGDALYGKSQNIFGFKGQALHAHHLSFTHPVTGRFVDVRGRAPALFRRAVGTVQKMHLLEEAAY